MWIFLNDSFLSIIAHPTRKHLLVVRARQYEDIENVFPDARVESTPKRDYQYRAVVSRKWVARSLAREVDRIDYTNFKDSVPERRRHNIYLRVWTVMNALARRAWDEPEVWDETNCQSETKSWQAEEAAAKATDRQAEKVPPATTDTDRDDPNAFHPLP